MGDRERPRNSRPPNTPSGSKPFQERTRDEARPNESISGANQDEFSHHAPIHHPAWMRPQREERGSEPLSPPLRRNLAGVGPRNYRRSDDHIRDIILKTLIHHPDIDASEMEVVVRDGEVTLIGNVPDRDTRWLVEHLVASLDGVRDVYSELRFPPETMGHR